jgi:hypothetical protein
MPREGEPRVDANIEKYFGKYKNKKMEDQESEKVGR